MNTPSGSQHFPDGVDDRVHVLDMGEAVCGGDQCGRAVLALDLARHLGPEIALEGGNTALVGDCADVGRLDAEHAVAGVLEIRQQRAVIGADIDHEIVLPQSQHRRGFARRDRRNCRAAASWCRWCRDSPAER